MSPAHRPLYAGGSQTLWTQELDSCTTHTATLHSAVFTVGNEMQMIMHGGLGTPSCRRGCRGRDVTHVSARWDILSQ